MSERYVMPPEWAEQDWLWIGFPHDAALWEDDLAPAQEQIAAFANAVAASGQQVRLVVRNEVNAAQASALVRDDVVMERHPYGDIWLRDIGPVIVINEAGQRRAQGFGFNGWGGKYRLEGDQETAASMAAAAGMTFARADLILEGGAIDGDGTGLVVTTQQCLLNPNRNPSLTREDISSRLRRDLGFDEILWLGDGLAGDHTDGHVDNLARFIAPGEIAIPVADDASDPNADIYADAMSRAQAYGLKVHAIPSPGLVSGLMQQGEEAEPASYMNFVIANRVVIVPIYRADNDSEAVRAIGDLFPGRKAIGLRADAVLTGGGSFHCASQHMPSALTPS